MNRESKRTRRVALTLALALAACGDETTSPPQETPEARAAQAAGSTASGAGTTVTLITGDQVTLRAVDGGKTVTLIEPGPGRAQLRFAINERKGQISVVPEDMTSLVGSGQLDRALFNVTQLLAEGHGDDRSDHLPLIFTGVDGSAGMKSQIAVDGLSVDRTLSSLGMMAVRQQKGGPAPALEVLQRAAVGKARGGAARAAGTSAAPKVWLDRQLKLSLDQSVPQIGGPAARLRGLTGAGVTVAVLDTGVDETHPDLAGKVVSAMSFVEDGHGTADRSGHGTHVASTIAGSGAASGGQMRGVAPGVSLLSGKVCFSQRGCPFSAILSGMEWAAASGAQIVNMSLGGADFPELDPLEEAVNQLSAQYGTLFVIAAGNFGGVPRTVDSPSSADAALSVGAVDRQDRLALFSGQGPRIGDGALKPDLTAPGVGIVAARAAGTALGTPFNDLYRGATGTSMATPHVAGAAALLLQQHPEWSGRQLKDALMSAAQPNETLSAFEQGAGRVDVDRATRQLVTAEPGSLSLGLASFPHNDDPPIVRTLRYYNHDAAPITLTLSASLSARRSGEPAPAEMVALSTSSLVVPANGSAEAVLTVDTSVEAADDLYTGRVAATGDGVRVLTPVAVEREGEVHELTVVVTAADGQPGEASVGLAGLGPEGHPARDVDLLLDVIGQATFRVPAGLYLLNAIDFVNDTYLLAPRIAVAGATTVAMDATLARPVEVTLPDQGYSVSYSTLDYVDNPTGAGNFLAGPRPFSTAHIGPEAAPGELVSNHVLFMTPSENPARTVYHLARASRDRFSTGWRQSFRRSDFAKVESHHVGSLEATLEKVTAVIPLLGGLTLGYGQDPVTGPFRRTDYYYGTDHLRYVDLREYGVSTIDTIEDYRAGQHYRETWNQAPFGPGFAASTLNSLLGDRSGAPQRIRNFLVLAPSLFTDQAVPSRNAGSVMEQGSLKLFRDGQLFSEAVTPARLALSPSMPAARSTYRLEAQATRSPEVVELSTEVRATWTFQAEGGSSPELYPLPVLRFQPSLDEHNRTGARALLLPIEIERPFGAPTPSITSAAVEVSFDDGATWKRLPIVRFRARALGLVVHPRGASYVSLRGSASDAQGNAVEQTIIRAYALR